MKPKIKEESRSNNRNLNKTPRLFLCLMDLSHSPTILLFFVSMAVADNKKEKSGTKQTKIEKEKRSFACNFSFFVLLTAVPERLLAKENVSRDSHDNS